MMTFLKQIMLFTLCAMLLGQSNVGTTSASFLDIGIGARSLSMGGAFTSIADDASALYWNPAGITNIKKPQGHFFYAPWFVDIDFAHGSAVIPLGRSGTLGFAITSVTMGEMKVRTISDPEGTGELFEVSNFAMASSYARKLTDRFSFGFNLKLIQEKIWHMSANSLATDIGCLFVTKNRGIRIGMSISNFGNKMKLTGFDTERDYDIDETIYGNNDKIDSHLDTQGWPLPLVFRAGISHDILKNKIHSLTIAGDAIHPNNNYEYVNIGLEYKFMNIASVRAGTSYIFLEQFNDTELSSSDNKEFRDELANQITLGAGLNYKIPRGPQITIDYVVRDFGVLNSINGYSINITF